MTCWQDLRRSDNGWTSQLAFWSCRFGVFTCPIPPAAPATTALTILLSYLGRAAEVRGRGSSKLVGIDGLNGTSEEESI